MKLHLSIIAILIGWKAFCTETNVLLTPDTCQFIFQLNENIIYQENIVKGGRIYLNHDVIDSTGTFFQNIYLLNNEKLIGVSHDNNKSKTNIYMIDLIKRNVVVNYTLKGFYNSFFTANNELYFLMSNIEQSDYNQFLLLYDYYNSRIEKILDLGSFTSNNEIVDISSLNDNSNMIITVEPAGAGYDDAAVFLLDSNKTIEKVSTLIDIYRKHSHISYKLVTFNSFNFYNYYTNKNIGGYLQTNLHTICIKDDLNKIDSVLPMNFDIKGIEILKGDTSFYLVTNNDDNERTVFLYKFNYQLLKLYLTVFNSLYLYKSDLSLLDKGSLELLKQMIYAKHNYKFNDLYYQAYFNMFYFYNFHEMVERRRLNIDKQLTKNDKSNLKIIEKTLSQFK